MQEKEIPQLSLCSIAKNEAPTFNKMVDSVKGIVREIVFRYDDKTTDGTDALMRKYQDELDIPVTVDSFTWNDDFSAARNNALKDCNGRWIIWLDGHEYIRENSLMPIVDYMTNMPYNVWMLESWMYMDPDEDGIPYSFFLQPHIFRNHKDPDFRMWLEQHKPTIDDLLSNWKDDVEEITEEEKEKLKTFIIAESVDSSPKEQLKRMVLDDQSAFECLLNGEGVHYKAAIHNFIPDSVVPSHRRAPSNEIVVVHERPKENEEIRKEQRKEINNPHFEKKLEEDPNDYRSLFYLGNQYAAEDRNDEAIDVYERYLEVTEWDSEAYQVCLNLAKLYHHHKNDLVKAREILVRATQYDWGRSEAYLALGHTASLLNDVKQAEHWIKLAANTRPPMTKLFMFGPHYTYLPWMMMAGLYMGCDSFESAIEACQEVFKFKPNYTPAWDVMEKCYQELGIVKYPEETKGKKIVVFDSLSQFSEEFINHWRKDNTVLVSKKFNPVLMKRWADVAFFEWSDQNLIEGSKRKWVGKDDKPVRVITRCHGYETLDGLLGNVTWENVDELVFVNQALKDFSRSKYGKLPCKVSVIDNGLNLEKFRYTEHKPGKTIGWVGFVNWKKQPGLLLQAAAELRTHTFKVAGSFQDDRTKEYFFSMIDELKLTNIDYVGPLSEGEMPDFYKGIDYLLTTSMYESPSFAILEAMASGVKPLIHQFVNAEDHYPSKLIWKNLDELREMIRREQYDSLEYRNFIAERYPLSNQLKEMDALIA